MPVKPVPVSRCEKGQVGKATDPRVASPEGMEPGRTREIVSARFGVGGTTVQKAANILNRGVPEVVKKVEAGTLTGTQQQPEPSDCFGGHLTDPNEQNTQQSPGLGLSTVLHCSH